MSWLLDASVFKDFHIADRIPVLQAVLPRPIYTGPLQRTPNEIGERFMEVLSLEVPSVDTNDLLDAEKTARRVDSEWALSNADMALLAYAICTDYSILTRDAALRRCCQKLGIRVWGTLELLDSGITKGHCTSADAIEIVDRLLNARPPRHIKREQVDSFKQKWKRV